MHFPHREKLDECLEVLEITLLDEYAKNYEAIVNAWRRYLKEKKNNMSRMREDFKTVMLSLPSFYHVQAKNTG